MAKKWFCAWRIVFESFTKIEASALLVRDLTVQLWLPIIKKSLSIIKSLRWQVLPPGRCLVGMLYLANFNALKKLVGDVELGWLWIFKRSLTLTFLSLAFTNWETTFLKERLRGEFFISNLKVEMRIWDLAWWSKKGTTCPHCSSNKRTGNNKGLSSLKKGGAIPLPSVSSLILRASSSVFFLKTDLKKEKSGCFNFVDWEGFCRKIQS